MRAAAAAVAVVLLIGITAHAQLRRPLSGPQLVRIEVVLGAKPPGPLPLTSWKVSYRDDLYDLHVSKLRVLDGNVAYFNIVDRLEPYWPSFSIAGDETAIQAFINAPHGEPLVILGYLRIDPAARVLMLSSVAIASPTPAPTIATPPPP